MKFLIQKINGGTKHDFAFTLIESIRFHNWLHKNDTKYEMKYKFINSYDIVEPDDIYPIIQFKSYHKNYIPIGSVEFVNEFLYHFYPEIPQLKPINVPEELLNKEYSKRIMFNGDETDIVNGISNISIENWFIKSNDVVKGLTVTFSKNHQLFLPKGNYQFSEYISIDSEWRAFVYKNKLVGLQNYCGEFTKFPNVNIIKEMILNYKSAPIVYTLDVGINDEGTFIIEVHSPINSCGLYGFANHAILHKMFYDSFKEIVKQM